LEQIDLLKIDIEGAEHEAIAGAADLLAARKIKAIILEQHPVIDMTTGHQRGDIAAVLAKNSYSGSSELEGVWLAPN
jgi:hypothetical protein